MTRGRANLCVCLLSAAVSLAGCGIVRVPPGNNPVAVASTPIATPIPTPDQDKLRAAAAQAYLVAATYDNRIQDRILVTYGNAKDLATLRDKCRVLADQDDYFILAMQKITWPVDTTADGAKLIELLKKEQATHRACGKAATKAAFDKVWRTAQSASVAREVYSGKVRSDLRLPPVPH